MDKNNIIKSLNVINQATRIIYAELSGDISKEIPEAPDPPKEEKKKAKKQKTKMSCLNKECGDYKNGYCNFKGGLAECSERIEG